MKSTVGPGIPLHGLLPFIIVLTLGTVFNAVLTWNDFNMLSTIRCAGGLGHISGKNEVPFRLDPVALMVDANPHYGMSADDEWESLLPSNHASGIHLDPSQEQGQYIAVYHQLGCLNSLRQLYVNPGWEDDREKKARAHHCMNILRQAVLCNADTTLEPSLPQELSTGQLVDTASGMNVLHVCRDWEQLRALAEEDRFATSHHSKHE